MSPSVFGCFRLRNNKFFLASTVAAAAAAASALLILDSVLLSRYEKRAVKSFLDFKYFFWRNNVCQFLCTVNLKFLGV